MPTYRTPGVYIEHVLPEPARVLRTGVPVFLGLIRQEELNLYNAEQSDVDERYVEKPIPGFPGIFLARKRGYLKLPRRPASAVDSIQGADHSALDRTFNLRHISGDQSSIRNSQVLRTSGAGGRPGGPAEDDPAALQAISDMPQRFTAWAQFSLTYDGLAKYGFLNFAVRGFFENEGSLCYVQLVSYAGDSPAEGVRAGLKTLEAYDVYDLICVPDIMWSLPQAADNTVVREVAVREMQTTVLRHCETLGNCFALLDSLPTADRDQVLAQRQALTSEYGALYYPWAHVIGGPAVTRSFVPPCGHVAGVIARTDMHKGVHKAPANEVLEGVVDLEVNLSDEQQGDLNEDGINCVRSFPRRGIRVWGARTLSRDPAWKYIHVRRIFLTAARWIEYNMTDVVFEPNNAQLWGRIVRDLTVLHRAVGARCAGRAYCPGGVLHKM